MVKIFTSSAEGDKHVIDTDKVEDFFLERAKKLIDGKLSYKQAVIYQDKNESLADARDITEKELLLPKLRLSREDNFLDIGCGTGRWAEAVAEKVSSYHGTDLIEDLIVEAEKRVAGENIRFTTLACTLISMEKLKEKSRFDKIICFGVLMYINDDDICKVMENIASVANEKCVFLLREPIGINGRLTIKEHFSEDMEQFYNATYRTENELISMCLNVLKPLGFNLTECDDVFSNPEYNNRIETKQKYFLFERN